MLLMAKAVRTGQFCPPHSSHFKNSFSKTLFQQHKCVLRPPHHHLRSHSTNTIQPSLFFRSHSGITKCWLQDYSSSRYVEGCRPPMMTSPEDCFSTLHRVELRTNHSEQVRNFSASTTLVHQDTCCYHVTFLIFLSCRLLRRRMTLMEC